MAGVAFAAGYPTTAGAFQTTFAGATDVSISIFSANGQTLLASTYLGGTGNEYPHSIITASNGDLYVLGRTESNNFPTTAGCFDNTFNGGTTDIFVARLNSTLTTLLASTYVGGNGLDGTNVVNSFTGTTQTRFSYANNGRGQIRLDGSGNVCVASCTQSTNFPTTAGAFDNTLSGIQDGVVFKMNNTLTTQVYSTLVGGANYDACFSLQIGTGNTLFVAGLTNSADFPTTAGVIHPTAMGGVDGFVFRINATGTALAASTYLGTANKDGAFNVDVNSSGVYVYGLSTGGTYPVTGGVYSNANSCQFIHGLNLTLTTTQFSTVFGNGVNPNLSPTAFEVDTCNKIYAAGWGRCFDGGNNIGMPITPGAFQSITDNCDFYFIVLEPNAASLRYGTYFGQGGGTADHVDGGTSLFSNNSTESGVVYQAVCASCGAPTNGFPVTPSAYASNDGSTNCNNAVFKFDLETYAPGAAAIASSGNGCVGAPITFTNNSTNATSYLWNFGDASTSTATNPSHTYAAAGTYTVTLVAFNSTTCILSDTATTVVTITQPSVSVSVTAGTNPTCNGSAVTLTAAGANTYTWNPGALTGTSVVVSPATTTTYTVIGTTTATGCTDTATITITVNPIPTTPAPTSNSPVCTGNTINLSTAAVAGATYAWTGPAAFTSSLQNPTRPSATVAMAGTYSVTVTTSGCTSAVGTTAVVVNTTPATPSGTSNSPVCTGNTINLSTPAVAGATYSWTGPSAFSSSLQNPSRPSATLAMAGTYSLTVTVGGCTSAAGTTAVVVNTTPATPTASSNSPVCTGNSLNLSTPAVAGATYSWTGPNSFASSLQNPTITGVTAAAAGTYSVTVTVGGCTSAVGTTAVVVNTTPAAPTASSNSPVCTGNTINLSTPAVAGATYAWTGPSAFTSSLQNPTRPSATLAMAGTYSVTVTVGGCTSAAGTTAVVINSTPATPTASSNTPVYSGNTLNLSTPLVAGATYSWTGPNSFTSSLQNPSITGVTTAASGTYSVTVTVGGCTSAAGTTAVTINATPATPAPTSNSPVCIGNTINLSTAAVAGATYSWTGPAAFTSSLQNPTRPSATLAMAGTYSVTVTLGGCTSAAGTTVVNVVSPPATPTASSNSPVCTGNTLNLSTPAVAGATYAWTGPNSFTSTAQNPSITGVTTAAAGTYSVTVTVGGCTSAAGTTVVTINTTPATPAASSNSPVCSGNTLNLWCNRQK